MPDFLNFVIALHRRLKVEIPEADHPALRTIADAIAYLVAKAKTLRTDSMPGDHDSDDVLAGTAAGADALRLHALYRADLDHAEMRNSRPRGFRDLVHARGSRAVP